jgi:DNA-binding transcriptional MerR regulator
MNNYSQERYSSAEAKHRVQIKRFLRDHGYEIEEIINLSTAKLEVLERAVRDRLAMMQRINEPFKIKVLLEPGKTISYEQLPEKEQAEVKEQMRIVSEIADLEITETDELIMGGLNAD